MKNIFLIISLTFISYFSFSQNNMTWFGVSAKGGYGTSLLINSPSMSDSNIEYLYFSPSYFYGGKFGLLFGDYVGVSAEVTMNSFSQNYNVTTTIVNQQNITFSTFDYGFMLNLQSPTGFFFDLGPKFSELKKATLNTNLDRTSNFLPAFTSVAMGVGFKALMTDKFEIKLGLRGTYAISSIVSQTGYIIPTDGLYTPTYTDEKTNPLQVMFCAEFTYVFGRFGKARCGKYQFMFN